MSSLEKGSYSRFSLLTGALLSFCCCGSQTGKRALQC